MQRFRKFSEGRTDDDIYDFWSGSTCDINPPQTVPVQVPRVNRKRPYTYSPLGLHHYYPFFVLDANPTSHDGFLNVMTSLLPAVNKILARGCYPVFRGDINIYMAWLRVS